MTLAHALVYVIDDDVSMLKASGRLLESEDYSVELFTGAGEFLARAPHIGGHSSVCKKLYVKPRAGSNTAPELPWRGFWTA